MAIRRLNSSIDTRWHRLPVQGLHDRRQFVQRVIGSAIWLSAIGEAFAQQSFTKVKEGEMKITRNGSQPSNEGPAEWFTGKTRVDPLFNAPDPARVAGASVTFEPGSRTAWHTHPLGQTLIVTSGLGRVQVEGGPIEEIRPGDVVWFPPGIKKECHDPYRHSRSARWQSCRVDGACN